MSQHECACDAGESAFDFAPLDAVLAEHGPNPGSPNGDAPAGTGSNRGAGQSALIPVLQSTQDAYGYLPEEALSRIAQKLRMPLSAVYGVATFYTQFHLEPRGRRIVRICHGTACHVRGADEVTRVIEDELGVKVGTTAEDLSFTIESVACVGCCGLAPVVLVDDQTFGGLDAQSARRIASRFHREQTQ
jgi:NADH-quinone oxidoreductase subunit E